MDPIEPQIQMFRIASKNHDKALVINLREQREALADCFLYVGEDGPISANRAVLSAMSPVLRKMLTALKQNNANPTAILLDSSFAFAEVETVVDFMYTGYVEEISRERLQNFLRIAIALRVEGIRMSALDDATPAANSQQVEPSNSQQVEPSNSQQVEASNSQHVEPSNSQQVEPSNSQKIEPSNSQQVEPSNSQKIEPFNLSLENSKEKSAEKPKVAAKRARPYSKAADPMQPKRKRRLTVKLPVSQRLQVKRTVKSNHEEPETAKKVAEASSLKTTSLGEKLHVQTPNSSRPKKSVAVLNKEAKQKVKPEPSMDVAGCSRAMDIEAQLNKVSTNENTDRTLTAPVPEQVDSSVERPVSPVLQPVEIIEEVVDKELFFCGFCERRYKHVNARNKHERECPNNPYKEVVTCDECDVQLKPSLLRHHMKTIHNK